MSDVYSHEINTLDSYKQTNKSCFIPHGAGRPLMVATITWQNATHIIVRLVIFTVTILNCNCNVIVEFVIIPTLGLYFSELRLEPCDSCTTADLFLS